MSGVSRVNPEAPSSNGYQFVLAAVYAVPQNQPGLTLNITSAVIQCERNRGDVSGAAGKCDGNDPALHRLRYRQQRFFTLQ